MGVVRTVELATREDQNGITWRCWADLLASDPGEGRVRVASHWAIQVCTEESYKAEEDPRDTITLLLPPDWQPTPYNRGRVATAMLALVLPLDLNVVPVESVVRLAGDMARGVLRDGVASATRLQEVSKRLEQARVEALACLEVLADAMGATLEWSTVLVLFEAMREGLKHKPIAVALVKHLEGLLKRRYQTEAR